MTRLALLLLVAGAALAACGAEEPRWLPLAALPADARSGPAPGAAPAGPRIVQENGEAWLETELLRAAWRPMERPGRWRTTPPLRSPGRGLSSRARLASAERTFEQQRSGEEGEPPGTPGTFALLGNWLVLQLLPGEEPPASATLALHSAREPRRDGVAHVNGRRFSGKGFSVWPGERLELVLDVPPASVLRVALCVEALLTDAAPRAYGFRILLDGAPLLAEELQEAADGNLARHEIALPAGGVRGARLVFEVSGPLGMTAFLDPVIAPLAPPARAPTRPDLVLFVADTFRADNLAAYGGTPGLTPNLDALVGESQCFARAHSVATHTGPSHAAILSGQYPPRVSVDVFGNSLPEEVVTIAEELARAGYRTGAVTDSVVVSRSFGMNQGFDWFDELRADMDSTRARVLAFLAQDDGRPTFLFVHTYRVHAPYVSSAETRTRLASVLGPDQGGETEFLAEELKTALRKVAGGASPGIDAPTRALAARFEARYRAGVAEFDQEFGALLAEPLVRGLLDGGYLLFTSDHGEAFLEHDELFHSGRVFEEQIRIPFLLHGPGLEPGTRAEPASLVDVTPTLADLAGLPRAEHWQGRSLRAASAPRPYLYAFECNGQRPATMAVLAAEHKLMAILDQPTRQFVRPYAAFDLVRDPGEERDLLAGAERWPGELYGHLEAQRAELLETVIQQTRAQIDAEQRGELEALGYGGR